MIRVAIITISDRSYSGEREDFSGPILSKIVDQPPFNLQKTAVLPDEFDQIRDLLIAWSDSGDVDLILTTGGTGFAPRDITPEATLAVVEKNAPGLVETMRQVSMKITPHAMLSRSVAGIRKNTLIVNLPGNPKAAKENLETIILVLPHAIELLQDSPTSEAGHTKI